MKYQCIIFDCDGVLVDSEAISISVIVDMARAVGYNMEMENAIALFSGQSLQYCFDYINQHSPQPLPDNAIPEFRRLTFEAYKSDIQAIPHIKEVLVALKEAAVPFCVASNAPMNKIELNLGLLNLADFFEGNMFSAYTNQKWKPDPDLFLHAAKTMGFEPNQCAVIEDSLAGVKAGVAGGFDVFGYANERRAKTLEDAGAKVFFSMQHLISLLKE